MKDEHQVCEVEVQQQKANWKVKVVIAGPSKTKDRGKSKSKDKDKDKSKSKARAIEVETEVESSQNGLAQECLRCIHLWVPCQFSKGKKNYNKCMESHVQCNSGKAGKTLSKKWAAKNGEMPCTGKKMKCIWTKLGSEAHAGDIMADLVTVLNHQLRELAEAMQASACYNHTIFRMVWEHYMWDQYII